MTNPPTKPHNGYRAVRDHAATAASDEEEMVPKGTPHSDRYDAETSHAAETDDQTRGEKADRKD